MAETRKKVLIIDDDAVLTHEWSKELRSRGYAVSTCLNTYHGFEACLKDWPDIIVLDAFFRDEEGKASGSGGLLFCTQISIHAHKNGKVMPKIVGVTATHRSEFFPFSVFQSVSNDVMPVRMVKPFARDALVDEVDRLPVHDSAAC